MKINGVELQDIDFLDLEVAEKYEKALNNVEKIAASLEGATITESIRKQCNAVFDSFNILFGEGTDKKIFGNKVNLLTCLKAFEELVEYVNTPNEEVKSFVNKYSPNRAKRRSKK
ncbi:AP endonuclease [Clostridium botulinum]|uniref:DUF6673 family protein n=1 Tax=Clostridium botulinum TaxID=1491 RepID=UPI0005F8C030|nr:DUF6673 family protein [Clostridium botulinum]APH22540.1 aP endonuclease, family 2 [Clostridium botulinum]APQ70802.1 aP endonuclease, family 2 [Clostridium botulinum]MBE1302937.1 AP endonuclease [Clostridium botulinum]MBN3380865.1 AP endonuclease [Clostridium botulinum]MBN3406222.1 AP endonuclease [Clostridium botulinum]